MENSSGNRGFHSDDPMLLEDRLSQDERIVCGSAQGYAKDKLMPRLLMTNREER